MSLSPSSCRVDLIFWELFAFHQLLYPTLKLRHALLLIRHGGHFHFWICNIVWWVIYDLVCGKFQTCPACDFFSQDIQPQNQHDIPIAPITSLSHSSLICKRYHSFWAHSWLWVHGADEEKMKGNTRRNRALVIWWCGFHHFITDLL